MDHTMALFSGTYVTVPTLDCEATRAHKAQAKGGLAYEHAGPQTNGQCLP